MENNGLPALHIVGGNEHSVDENQSQQFNKLAKLSESIICIKKRSQVLSVIISIKKIISYCYGVYYNFTTYRKLNNIQKYHS